MTWREVWRRLTALVLQGLAVAPLCYLLALHLCPDAPLPLLLIPAVAGIGCLCIGLLPSRLRGGAMGLWAMCSVGAVAFCMRSAGIRDWVGGIAYGMLCGALVPYLSITCAATPPGGVLMAALGLHAVCGIWASRPVAPVGAAQVIFALACGYLTAWVLHLNGQTLRALYARQSVRPPRALRWGNGALCLALLALTFLLAEFDRVRAWVGKALATLLRWIMALLALLAPVETTRQAVEPPSPMDMMPVAPAEPALFWIILEKVFLVLGVCGAVWALLLLLRQLYRVWPALLAKLQALLGRYAHALQADYSDETMRLEDEGAWEKGLSALRRAFSRLGRDGEKPWRAMDNRQRIRSVYGRLARSRRVPAQVTAQEALQGLLNTKAADAGTLAHSYDKARYSPHAVDDAEVENAKRAL